MEYITSLTKSRKESCWKSQLLKIWIKQIQLVIRYMASESKGRCRKSIRGPSLQKYYQYRMMPDWILY